MTYRERIESGECGPLLFHLFCHRFGGGEAEGFVE